MPSPPPTMFPAATIVSPAVAKDAIIAWYRGEFAAANAIIDSLCNHLRHSSSSGEYEGVFGAIHRRRVNWIPVIQMQKFFSIGEVVAKLRSVEEAKEREESGGGGGEGKGEIGCGDRYDEESPESEITDTGSQESQATPEPIEICDDHEDCETRRERIKMTKGFVAKEPVKGHMVNVVKGLRMYEDVFTASELVKLNNLAKELRTAGQNGELPGETYVLFNTKIKGNKREQIQLGAPVFGPTKDEAAVNVEPIPALLQNVIDHLVQWWIMPENRRPNSCILNYFDEGEYSQPYLKPPHLDQPLCNLILSESEIAFGHTLACDHEGSFKGQLTLSLKGGSLIVMRNHSADMAGHIMCPSPTRRVSIMFFRVRPDVDHSKPAAPVAPISQAMTFWQPAIPASPIAPNGLSNGYGAVDVIQKWGVIRSPVVMLAPMRPLVMNPRRIQCGGTGVYLPWAVGSRNRVRHLPPRAQKGRRLALPPIETHVSDTMSDPGMETRKML
ncbi:hypothetical protein Droror1_Dr00003588 [Drosera rotundifolia]